MMSEACIFGRLANNMSWVLRNSSAASGDDTMIAGLEPSFMDMMGPYFLARFWRLRWGKWPNMWRLPMTGRASGPGGSFRPFFRRR